MYGVDYTFTERMWLGTDAYTDGGKNKEHEIVHWMLTTKDGNEFEFNYLSDSIEAISINTSILINGNHSFTFTEYNAQH